MNRFILSAESGPEDLEPLGLALHELLNRLPITARSLERPGIRIEDGRVIDANYSGPVLEQVLQENRILKVTPSRGAYKGVPVVVGPIRDSAGAAITAIGIVDITGIFDLATLMDHQSEILKQVCGKDPCPLPGEQVVAKR
ncbi:MAG TPA: DUF2111 domain-containing protein [Methanolinea sp.]|jgi:hypothetical protein|nr:MAG: hypothetical protein A4E36_00007 [Methanoregulaceae archaeon PtaB.Bin009]HII76193.1 DUF2111 domain-containing protein [Methanolinea sp.]HNQ30238.1 DUF2111 domain-containing protein [Methanolinea sp.]HNS83278.1 DUF2111 domain-containing protein [Methanolinea sp.]